MINRDKLTKEDVIIIKSICKRAIKLKLAFNDYQALTMDIEACHINQPLDLTRLLNSDVGENE